MGRTRWQQDVVPRNCRPRCREVTEYTHLTHLTLLTYRLTWCLMALEPQQRPKDLDHPFEGNWELPLQNRSLLLDQFFKAGSNEPVHVAVQDKRGEDYKVSPSVPLLLIFSWSWSHLQAANIFHQCFRSCCKRLLHLISFYFCRLMWEGASCTFVCEVLWRGMNWATYTFICTYLIACHCKLVKENIEANLYMHWTSFNKSILEAMTILISVTIPTAAHFCRAREIHWVAALLQRLRLRPWRKNLDLA